MFATSPRRGARLALHLVLLAWLASTCAGQAPPAQVVFQPNYTAAQQQAKKTGLPILALVLAKGSKSPAAFADAKVVKRAQVFHSVTLAAESLATKKLKGAAAGAVLFLDGSGAELDQLEPDFSTELLLQKMADVMGQARAQALERLKNDKESSAVHKTALDAYVRLGARGTNLIPLLTHKSVEVKVTLRGLLAARVSEGVDWFLLEAMASPDAELRAAYYPAALEVTKATKVRPLRFWKEGTAEERAAELEKWREEAYGQVPPLNKAILDFTFANYGKQVNNGECAMLVVDAFKAVKAQPMRKAGQTNIWGRPLAADENGLVGDIVQLENTKFSNGFNYPHHTQIIRRVLGKGEYEVLEQNVSGRRTVGPGKINMAQLTQGTVVIFRPLPKDGEKK